MEANNILLQKKYVRIIAYYAKIQNISERKALDRFYNSKTYEEISQGIADMHCMSDAYLAEELQLEYNQD